MGNLPPWQEFQTHKISPYDRRRACEILDINERTARRWRRQLQAGDGFEDQRKKSGGARRVPANKLTEEEKAQIIELLSSLA
uniref:Helix-turn-helix domain-containing protein n=2 Tax=Candidatus Kentrum sp. TUN TaxID=2126343 RepID=A0A451A8P3_9GAMM|nr:MAG: Helix-turn-helix domain-containing protein [Candidatus Kentron sp. TUN]